MIELHFVNKEYKPEWEKFVPNTNDTVKYCDGTVLCDNQDHNWSVYDGAGNFCGTVNAATKEITVNSDNKNDPYCLSFIYSAKAVIPVL